MASLKLGQSTNLLHGYNATVFLDGNAIKPSTKQALVEETPVVKDSDLKAEWSLFPDISLHDTAEELLSAVQRIKLQSCYFEKLKNGGGSPKWPAGALMLGGISADERTKALRNLSAEIGLDLSPKGISYVLVQRKRKNGVVIHGSFKNGRCVDNQGTLLPETLEALKKLEKTSQEPEVSKDGAKGYLDFYDTFGSHFVYSIEFGDILYQVSTS